jgi:hypothetical protein
VPTFYSDVPLMTYLSTNVRLYLQRPLYFITSVDPKIVSTCGTLVQYFSIVWEWDPGKCRNILFGYINGYA